MTRQSCGAILYTFDPNGKLGIILGEEKGNWLPFKGRNEGYETWEETARREIFEETGGLLKVDKISLDHVFATSFKIYRIGLLYVDYSIIDAFDEVRKYEVRYAFLEKSKLKFFAINEVLKDPSVHNMSKASIQFYWDKLALLAYNHDCNMDMQTRYHGISPEQLEEIKKLAYVDENTKINTLPSRQVCSQVCAMDTTDDSPTGSAPMEVDKSEKPVEQSTMKGIMTLAPLQTAIQPVQMQAQPIPDPVQVQMPEPSSSSTELSKINIITDVVPDVVPDSSMKCPLYTAISKKLKHRTHTNYIKKKNIVEKVNPVDEIVIIPPVDISTPKTHHKKPLQPKQLESESKDGQEVVSDELIVVSLTSLQKHPYNIAKHILSRRRQKPLTYGYHSHPTNRMTYMIESAH